MTTTAVLELGPVMPAGFDPGAVEAAGGSLRHAYAAAMVDEAKSHANAVERFVELIAAIRQGELYKLIRPAYQTFDGFVAGEFGVSRATGRRWVQQGNEIKAAGGPPPKAIGAGGAAEGIGIERPNQPARISQRAAAKAQAERRKPLPPSIPDAPAAEAAVVEPAAVTPRPQPGPVEPERPDQAPAELRGRERGRGGAGLPEPPRAAPKPAAAASAVVEWEAPEPPAPAQSAADADRDRENLDVLLNFIESLDPKALLKVATAQERSVITRFAAVFVDRKPEPAAHVQPKDCKHPRNRRIGDYCPVCDSKVKP